MISSANDLLTWFLKFLLETWTKRDQVDNLGKYGE